MLSTEPAALALRDIADEDALFNQRVCIGREQAAAEVRTIADDPAVEDVWTAVADVDAAAGTGFASEDRQVPEHGGRTLAVLDCHDGRGQLKTGEDGLELALPADHNVLALEVHRFIKDTGGQFNGVTVLSCSDRRIDGRESGWHEQRVGHEWRGKGQRNDRARYC